MRIVMNRRARLGIKVNLRARETDSLGAYVDAVTPNGPAAKAGHPLGRHHHQAGRQVGPGRRGGRRVAPAAVAARAPADRARRPARAQRHRARRVPPGQGAEDRLGGDRGRARHVSACGSRRPVASPSASPRRARARTAHAADDDLEARDTDSVFLAGSPLADLELAPLNSDLGQYFGHREGCW